MSEISLKLSVEEANLVLEGLGNLPFVKVHELIRKIHDQASRQLQSPEVPTPEISSASVASITEIDSEPQTVLNTGADRK